MWPFSGSFERTLYRATKGIPVQSRSLEVTEGDTMSSIGTDHLGFYSIDWTALGRLCGLILAQAASDGAQRVKLHYGMNRMIYTIDGVDYDMVPCPPPMNVDLVRGLARASGLTWEKPGVLKVDFADCAVRLTVTHHLDVSDPYLEISGFSGTPRRTQAAEQAPA